jgi:hypothetical protein
MISYSKVVGTILVVATPFGLPRAFRSSSEVQEDSERRVPHDEGK